MATDGLPLDRTIELQDFAGNGMLIIFGGLPGTGKTTIARMLASRHSATYLRVDEIEQTLRSLDVFDGGRDIGAAGYAIAQALASSNLAIGQWVVCDCVNPVRESRETWRQVGRRADHSTLEIEMVCSDQMEHRRRVEERRSDIEGLALPTWHAVQTRLYEPWSEPRLIVDTAMLDPTAALGVIEREIGRRQEAD